MRGKLFILAVLSVAALQACAEKDHISDRLWYDKPASQWLEALPVGNSNLGAMVFGGVAEEEIQINEETFWSGGPHNNNSPRSLARLEQVRSLILSGHEDEAKDIINKDFIVGPHGMRFLPMCSLKMSFDIPEEYSDYQRSLDISDAVAEVSFKAADVTYTRQVIASLPDKILAVMLRADKKGALDFTLRYDSPLAFEVSAEGNCLQAVVDGVEQEGIPASLKALCRTLVETDGEVYAEDGTIVVKGASSAVLRTAAATNFVNYHDVSGDASSKVSELLSATQGKSFKTLLSKHEAAYHEQYDRVHLTLDAGKNSDLPTDKRLAAFAGSDDMAMVALMYNYGRYLLISSSQPGGQPANLQGVWNKEVMAPWDSKYTININAEMNYWPAEVAGLYESEEPLFSMIKD